MIFKVIIFTAAITTIAATFDDQRLLRSIRQLPEDTPYPNDKPCTPRARFRYYCNTCICSFTGAGAFCTRMKCFSGRFSEYDYSKAHLDPVKLKREVNQLENTPHIVTKAVKVEEIHELPPHRNCTSGYAYKSKCNICTCVKKDVPVCTSMKCSTGAPIPPNPESNAQILSHLRKSLL